MGKVFFFFYTWHTVSLVRRCYYSSIKVFLLPRIRGDYIKIQATKVLFSVRHQTRFRCFTLSVHEWFTCMNNYTPNISCKCFWLQQSLMFCFLRQVLSFYQTDLLPSESAAELFDVAGKCYVILVLVEPAMSLGAIHMMPEWLSFWNEFIPSPCISLYLFTWYRSDI